MQRLSFLIPVMACTLVAGCACPPLDESYASPRQTLATWQAQVCRDDARGEYACLSRPFKKRMGGWQNYRVARAAFLQNEPLTAWLLGRTDLAPYIVQEDSDPQGHSRTIVLEARGTRLNLRFLRESWVHFEYEDGDDTSVFLAPPVEDLFSSRDDDLWLRLPRARKRAEKRLAQVRQVRLESRWKIDEIAGLGSRPSEAP